VAALLSEALVITAWLTTDIGFLWFNVIGCALVVGLSAALDRVLPTGRGRTPTDGVGLARRVPVSSDVAAKLTSPT
jgi:hypothetical protein